ncbi:MAG: undecaprenyl-diphosphatase UppP [Ignavibacteriae bacterium]|nr:undecaprenyl-diphosphatase UppP [Ignavibacteria bacterium]MBI3365710.1 undecaprenyl-diphosphatase UppP [Ignavibacteriota bacterium]
MNLLDAILLGIIQGITEFLPISSTAHLTLAGKLLGLIDPARPEEWTAFIAIIQLGTVAAVLLYFAKDLLRMTSDLLVDIRKTNGGASRWSSNSRLAGQIVVGTIPVVIIGLVFKKIIEGYLTKESSTIATSMILLALVLLWAEKVGKRNRDQNQSTWKDALLVGLAQAAALIPGSSRSGTTITAGLFLGFRRETAARFSFLLSIPAVLASGLFEMYRIRYEMEHIGLLPTVVATLVSGIVGYASIAFLLRYLKTHSTMLFVYYRIALGIGLWWMVVTKSM